MAFGSWRDVAGSAKNTITPAAKRYLKSGMHAKGMSWMRMGFGVEEGFVGQVKQVFGKNVGKMGRLGGAAGIAFRGLGIAFAGYEMYEGYQKGGVWGAAKAGLGYAAESYAFGAILGSAAVPIGIGVGLGVGYVAGRKWAIDKGRQYALDLRRTKFGQGYVDDPYGSVATMRRRSVDALMSSRIGGNMGMGNESLRAYTPYFR